MKYIKNLYEEYKQLPAVQKLLLFLAIIQALGSADGVWHNHSPSDCITTIEATEPTDEEELYEETEVSSIVASDSEPIVL